jgi:hypothetical protein
MDETHPSIMTVYVHLFIKSGIQNHDVKYHMMLNVTFSVVCERELQQFSSHTLCGGEIKRVYLCLFYPPYFTCNAPGSESTPLPIWDLFLAIPVAKLFGNTFNDEAPQSINLELSVKTFKEGWTRGFHPCLRKLFYQELVISSCIGTYFENWMKFFGFFCLTSQILIVHPHLLVWVTIVVNG